MDINVREVEERDFPQLVALFQEFAQFEKVPDRMINSVEKMLREKEFFHCFVAENEANEIAGYVTYFFGYYTWVGKSLYMVKNMPKSNKPKCPMIIAIMQGIMPSITAGITPPNIY